MDVNIKDISGNWDKGYVLDKHTLSSTFLGNDEFGHPRFDTKRSEVGEALYQLKYKSDKSKAGPLAEQVATSIVPLLGKVGLIVPMPASNQRSWQPVNEVANELGNIIDVPVFENILVKLPQEETGPQLKDLHTKEEKQAALMGRFGINDSISNGRWAALLLDDLFDTGASMEAASAKLKTYSKIGNVYAVALTWK